MTDQERTQEKMEEYMKQAVAWNMEEQPNAVNGMMHPAYVECSLEEKSLTCDYKMLPWMVNRGGNCHGGIICTAFDQVTGAVARYFCTQTYAPTIEMDVRYLRPVGLDDTMRVTARAIVTGKTISQLTAQAFSVKTGKMTASCSAIFTSYAGSKAK